MKLSNYLEGGSLFTEINAVKQFPFFTEFGADTLDNLLNLKYGERLLFHKLEKIDQKVLANLLVAEFGQKWDSLIQAVDSLDDVTLGKKDITTETISNTESRSNNREDVSKVSAFDSDDLIDSGGNSSSGGDELEGTRERTLTQESKDINQTFRNLNLLEKHTIIDVVLRDVSNFTTLSLY